MTTLSDDLRELSTDTTLILSIAKLHMTSPGIELPRIQRKGLAYWQKRVKDAAPFGTWWVVYSQVRYKDSRIGPELWFYATRKDERPRVKDPKRYGYYRIFVAVPDEWAQALNTGFEHGDRF